MLENVRSFVLLLLNNWLQKGAFWNTFETCTWSLNRLVTNIVRVFVILSFNPICPPSRWLVALRYLNFTLPHKHAPAQEAHWTLRNQVIVYPRQLRENFLVPHSSPGSLGEMRRPSGFSIGGTWGQWRSRGGRKQELEDPEIVFPIVVTFVCFEEKSESGGNLVSTFTFLFFLLTFVQSKCSSHFWNTTEEGAMALKALVILQ